MNTINDRSRGYREQTDSSQRGGELEDWMKIVKGLNSKNWERTVTEIYIAA